MSQQQFGSQSGVLPDANKNAIFLTFLIEPSGPSAATVGRAMAALPAITEEVGGLDPAAGLVTAAGFGSAAWDRMFPAARPRQLRPFKALVGLGGSAPATPADLFMHIRGDRHDLNFELSCWIRDRLGAAVSLVEEVQGYFDHLLKYTRAVTEASFFVPSLGWLETSDG